MTRQKDWLILASLAAVGGAAALYFFGPESLRKVPDGLSAGARERTKWLELRLQQVSRRVDTLEKQLYATTDDFSQRLESLRDKTLEQYMPDLGADGNAMKLTASDLDHDLRRLPHG